MGRREHHTVMPSARQGGSHVGSCCRTSRHDGTAELAPHAPGTMPEPPRKGGWAMPNRGREVCVRGRLAQHGTTTGLIGNSLDPVRARTSRQLGNAFAIILLPLRLPPFPKDSKPRLVAIWASSSNAACVPSARGTITPPSPRSADVTGMTSEQCDSNSSDYEYHTPAAGATHCRGGKKRRGKENG